MATGKVLDNTVKEMIATISLEHPKWLGKQVHAELHRRLRAMNYPREKPEWPGLSAVHKELARQEDERGRRGESPDDMPWSLASLGWCDLSPGAIPHVLRVWALNLTLNGSPPLTIRQAKWVVRLSFVFDNTRTLLEAALLLSEQQQAKELAGTYPARHRDLWETWLMDYAALLHVESDKETIDKVASKTVVHSRAAMRLAREYEKMPEVQRAQCLELASDVADFAVRETKKFQMMRHLLEAWSKPHEREAEQNSEGEEHEGTHQEAEQG